MSAYTFTKYTVWLCVGLLGLGLGVYLPASAAFAVAALQPLLGRI